MRPTTTGCTRATGTSSPTGCSRSPDGPELVTQHHLTNSTVELDGDRADAETYFVAVHRRPGPPVSVGQFGGRYLDRLERRDGAWRINERVVVHDWSVREIVAPEWSGLEAFTCGGQAPDDPSYPDPRWRCRAQNMIERTVDADMLSRLPDATMVG